MQVGKGSAMKHYNSPYNSLTLAPQCTALIPLVLHRIVYCVAVHILEVPSLVVRMRKDVSSTLLLTWIGLGPAMGLYVIFNVSDSELTGSWGCEAYF